MSVCVTALYAYRHLNHGFSIATVTLSAHAYNRVISNVLETEFLTLTQILTASNTVHREMLDGCLYLSWSKTLQDNTRGQSALNNGLNQLPGKAL